uniref:PsbP-like protein 1, chloroplastic n=1 Tax=Anthurium amnicola TaxID=1678845 RepID=A0A1D1YHI8_9ARAE
MGSLQNPPAARRAPLSNASVPLSSQVLGSCQLALPGSALFPVHRTRRRCVPFQVRADASPSSQQEKFGRRQMFAMGTATSVFLSPTNSVTFAAETKKGFQAVLDKKDGYSFLYPFGWQEVVVQGQDKVFKDVIEPLESVSVNMVVTSKQDVRDLGSPQEVAEALVRKVLAPSTQKTKVVEASEHDVDGKPYYNFEFIAQSPNFTRHALGVITIGNGKFYTLTTGANERRWDKMKDKLHAVIDSFKIFSV